MVSQVKGDDGLEQSCSWKWWKMVGLWMDFDDGTNRIH